MIIARFEDKKGHSQYGVITDRSTNRAGLISGDIFGNWHRTEEEVEIKRLLAPVLPPNVIGIGLNYRDHVEESKMKIPTLPLVFLKATTSVTGPEEPIVLPESAASEVDYEAELVVVIGKLCRNVEPEDANSFILGYTCGNDVSARDCQLRIDGQWARGKSFDTFCPIGPWIITADELDPGNLNIKAILNGEVLQNSNTSQLIFSVPELVSFLSKQFTLLPGTIIMTGTGPGVGFARNPPKFMKAGDEIVVEIEKIGQLRNFVK